MKGLKISIVLGLSLFLLPIVSHADILDNAGVSNRAIEQTHSTINQRFSNLSTQPKFNIILDSKDVDTNSLGKNSVSIIVNPETNKASIYVSNDLEKEIPTEMIASVLTNSEGISLIESGQLESGLNSLSLELNNVIQTSSLGQNTFEYNKKEKEEKAAQDKKRESERKQKTTIYSTIGIVTLVVVASFILISVKNKNSFIYKLFNKKQMDEIQANLKEIFQYKLSNQESLKDLGLLHYNYIYKGVGISYNDLLESFKKELTLLFNSELTDLDLSEQTTLDTELVVERFIKKYVPSYQKKVETNLKTVLKTEYDVNPDIFETFAFKELLENRNISKNMISEYIQSENKEYLMAIQERERMLSEQITTIINTIDYETDKVALQKELETIIPKIKENYVSESAYSNQEVKTKYENELYRLVAKDRLSQKNLDKETESYILETMSDYNIAMATEKILNRTIDKARLLK